MLSGKARLLKERDGVRRRLDEAWVEDVLGIEPADPFDRRAIRIQYRHDQLVDPSDDSGAYVLAADKPAGTPRADNVTDERREWPALRYEDGNFAPARPRWIQPSLFDAPTVAGFPADGVPTADASVARSMEHGAAVAEQQISTIRPTPAISAAPARMPPRNIARPSQRAATGSVQSRAATRQGRFAVGRPPRETTNEFSWLRFLSGLAVGGVIGAFVLMLIASAS
ncbi:MAG: hypothetical protein HOP29_00210 [Phycisphaerales bacterium]|nr:hypothetical protein [Phycisphaerales bacterium]